MSLSDIANLRLSAQHIAQADFDRPEDVVRHMGAMQAQDYAGAKWAIGLRTKNCTEKDVEQAVADKKILRTWPQRGTIHFVVPEEVRWRLQLSSPRILAAAKRRHENLGLSQEDFNKALDLLASALRGSKQLSRPDMMQTLETGGITTASQRGYHILWYLAQTGHICFGPLIGKQPSFALLNEWVPKATEIDHDEAVQRLITKYFVSHGPATTQDLAWWSGLTMADVKLGIGLAHSVLTTIKVDGTTYYMGAAAPESPKGQTTFLLPGFDEYMLGYKDRSAALPFEHSQKIIPGNNGMFQNTIVIDGQITGTWKKKQNKSSVEVIHTTFGGAHVKAQFVQTERKFSNYLGY